MATMAGSNVHTHSIQQQMMHINSTHTHSIASTGMPHGLGLLTTVASLPPKYRSRYLNIKTKCENPLDLSVKPISPQLMCDVPMAVDFQEVYTEPEPIQATEVQTMAAAPAAAMTATVPATTIVAITQHAMASTQSNPTNTNTTATTTATAITHTFKPQQTEQYQQHHNKPITPPLTPTKRKLSECDFEESSQETKENYQKIAKLEKSTAEQKQPLMENTPSKQPIKTSDTAPKTSKNQQQTSTAKAARSNKATRKLKFDEETSSPVSGTIIRPLEEVTDGTVQYSNGDIDPKYNIVEITEETKAELAAIKNVIGDFVCRLCRIKFDDAFGLAQHRCACIVLLEYKCPECGKQFNCPANLASHRRWHKPRKDGTIVPIGGSSGSVTAQTVQLKKLDKEKQDKKKDSAMDVIYACHECGKKFKRQAYLKKHELTHQKQSGATHTIQAPHQQSQQELGLTSISPVLYGYEQNSNEDLQLQQQQQHHHNVAAEEVVIGYSSNCSSNNSSYEQNHQYESDCESQTSSTSSSRGYGRLQIIESGLTEEENIAAAALTNLRNCASVIQHTALAH